LYSLVQVYWIFLSLCFTETTLQKVFFVPLSYLCRIIDVVVLAKTAAEQVCCLFIPLLVYTLLLNWFHMFIQISLRILMAIFLNITIGHMDKWLFCYPEPSKWNELLLENNAQYLYIKIVMKKVVLNQIRTCQILLSINLNKFVMDEYYSQNKV
jgi:hypothetical protein